MVSSPDAPPTRGKERLVAIDANLGLTTSLSLTSVGHEPSAHWSEQVMCSRFCDLIGDLDFEIVDQEICQ